MGRASFAAWATMRVWPSGHERLPARTRVGNKRSVWLVGRGFHSQLGECAAIPFFRSSHLLVPPTAVVSPDWPSRTTSCRQRAPVACRQSRRDSSSPLSTVTALDHNEFYWLGRPHRPDSFCTLLSCVWAPAPRRSRGPTRHPHRRAAAPCGKGQTLPPAATP